ncbi:4Fe-4S binding protein [Flammeovirga aprica]|uniref:4Fe-4S binding protein n=1 Tax=Flammeovirga aprica JL-4 TaxID=694437 RepID=A0A7X9XBF9_9BACT|nr:4Fe-4S binding protein [Flammeovirga aprica]NME70618.1 4Fe-4S binding protein [Flammeovirga aprica JL-4]
MTTEVKQRKRVPPKQPVKKAIKKEPQKGLNSLQAYNLYRVVLIALLVVAVGISGGWKLPFLQEEGHRKKIIVTQSHLEGIYKKAKYFTVDKDKKYTVYNQFKDIIGYAISTHDYASHVRGFAGEVPVLIGFDKDSTIQGMQMLQHNESGEYIEFILDDKLLEKWNGLTFDRALYNEVDGITSATETSEAIIKTIQVTLSEVTGKELETKHYPWTLILQWVLTSATLLFGLLVCFYRPMKNYRTSMLIMVTIVMGFAYQKMISISFLHGWIVNGISLDSNLISFVLLGLSVILPITTKKQFYCHYMCPFGAAQELVGKVSPFQKRNMNFLKVRSIPLQTIATIVLICCILLGEYPELSFVEPFPAFSFKVVSWWMIGFGLLFIGLSFFYSKPWCKICPTGFVLDNCKKRSARDNKKYKIL